MVNVQIIGRLGADAEVKQTKNGKNFISFRMATEEYRNGKSETSWINVMDLSEKGQKMLPYLKKGSMVNIHGVETVDTYMNKMGEPQVSRDVIADRVDFVNSSKNTQDAPSTSNSTNQIQEQNDKMNNMLNVDCGTLIKPNPTLATNTCVVKDEVSSNDDIDDLPF